MVKYVEPHVFLKGKTEAYKPGIKRWLEYLEVEGIDYFLPDEDELSSPELVVALAAKRCYMSFEIGLNPNVTKIRKVWHDYLENILKQHHGSTLEHSVFNFAIEDISRVVSAELNRHRAGVAISEGSQRYIRPNMKKGGIRFVRPPSLGYDNEDLWDKEIFPDHKDFQDLKRRTSLAFDYILNEIERVYTCLEVNWEIDKVKSFAIKKKLTSLLRTMLPQGIATGGVWSFNLRALRHVVALRSSPHAEEGIAKLAGLLGKEMVEHLPNLACDFEQVDGFWVPKYTKI